MSQNVIPRRDKFGDDVAANRELIARMDKKIQATLARVWGDTPAAASKPSNSTRSPASDLVVT